MNRRDKKAAARFRSAYELPSGTSPSERADLFCYYIKNSPKTEDILYRIFKTKFYKSMCVKQEEDSSSSASSSSSGMVTTLSPAVLKAALDRGIQPNALTQAQIDQALIEEAEKKKQDALIQAGIVSFGLTAAALIFLKK